jgi:hypothetical protein
VSRFRKIAAFDTQPLQHGIEEGHLIHDAHIHAHTYAIESHDLVHIESIAS